MKRVLTLREKAILNNGILGAVWIIMGFVQIFKSNIFISLVASIIVLAGAISAYIPYLVKGEQEDEMSEYNSIRARSRLYDYIVLGMTICTLIAILKGGWMIDLKVLIPFILGGVKLLECMLFIIYEKVGA